MPHVRLTFLFIETLRRLKTYACQELFERQNYSTNTAIWFANVATVAVENMHPPLFSIFRRKVHTLGPIQIVFLKARETSVLHSHTYVLAFYVSLEHH